MSAFKTLFVAVIAVSLLTACSSAEKRAHRSQAETNQSQTELNERKMKIVDDYEKCVEKSNSEEDRAKCEALLKGAQALQ